MMPLRLLRVVSKGSVGSPSTVSPASAVALSSKAVSDSASPGSITSMKVLAASRTLCDLLASPSPRSSLIEPDLSSTSAAATVLRGTELAMIGTTQVCPVSGQVTVTLSVTV